MERQRRNQLEEELRDARRRLEADMELAYQDYQAQMLREGQLVSFYFLKRNLTISRMQMACMGYFYLLIGKPNFFISLIVPHG